VRGAGLITHLALGHVTLAEVPKTVAIKATYTPDPAATATYAPLLKEFVALYDKTKAIHKRLNGGRVSGHTE
jgi:sugar (pentulose or hexulose) kinase